MYLRACDVECLKLKIKGIDVPAPSRVLFGHTHMPWPAHNGQTMEFAGRPFEFWNTGGWLREEGADRFAELFIYDDSAAAGKEWSSVSIQ